MTDEDEIASLIGAKLTGIIADGDSMCWQFDSGQIVTVRGEFELLLTERVIQ